MAIFRVDKRTVTTEVADYSDLQVVDAWSGRAELSGTPHGEYAPKLFTMDSAGNVIDKDLRLPGDIQELTTEKATFITGGGVEVYEVLKS